MMIVRVIWCIYIWLHFSPVLYKAVECAFVTKPKNVAVLSGGVATLQCSSDSHQKGIIVWKTSKPGSLDKDIIYNKDLDSSVSSYISVTDSGDGNCNLNINASLAAAKKYICIESNTGDEASAELIVLEFAIEYFVPAEAKDESVHTSCSVVSTSRPEVGLLVECQPNDKGLSTKRNGPVQAIDDYFHVRYSIQYAGKWVPSIECEQRNTLGGRVFQGKPDSKALTFTWNLTGSKEWNAINCSTKFQESEDVDGNAFPALPYRYIGVPPMLPSSPSPSPTPSLSQSTCFILAIILLLVLLIIVGLLLILCGGFCCLKNNRCGATGCLVHLLLWRGLNSESIKLLQGCLLRLVEENQGLVDDSVPTHENQQA